MGLKYLTFPEKHEWFDCKNKLPSGEFQYEYVLTYSVDEQDYNILYYLTLENRWYTGSGPNYDPERITHWTYLPRQPDWFNNDLLPTMIYDNRRK